MATKSPIPNFILRSHTTDATALCFCNTVPTTTTPTIPTTTTGTPLLPLAKSLPSSISTLVSGSSDGKLKFWDLETRRVVLELNQHQGKGILNIEWNGTHLITQGRDGFIITWILSGKVTVQDGLILQATRTATVETGSYTFTKISLVPERPSLLIAPARNDIFFEMWNLENQKALVGHCVGRTPEIGGKTGMVMSLKLLWSEIDAIDAKTGKQTRREIVSAAVGVESGEIGIYIDVFSACLPGNERIVISEEIAVAKEVVEEVEVIQDVKDNQETKETQETNELDTAKQMSTQGFEKSLAASILGLTGDNATWINLHTEPVLCLDVCVDPSNQTEWFGVSGSADTNIGTFRINTTSGSIVSFETIKIKERGIGDVKIRSDGKIFATAGWDGAIRVFRVNKLQPLAILRYHEVSVHVIEFGDIQKGSLCSAGKDGKIACWSLYPKKEKKKLK